MHNKRRRWCGSSLDRRRANLRMKHGRSRQRPRPVLVGRTSRHVASATRWQSMASALHFGDHSLVRLDLQHRVVGVVDRDGQRLANAAQVKV